MLTFLRTRRALVLAAIRWLRTRVPKLPPLSATVLTDRVTGYIQCGGARGELTFPRHPFLQQHGPLLSSSACWAVRHAGLLGV